jgi:putative endonuclease
MTNLKRKYYLHGLIAEIIAALYLILKGYKILKWRYKTPQGEIDLIVYGEGYVVFAEVKQRVNVEEGLLSLTPHMRARITRAALHFIATHKKYADHPMRFDLVAVQLPCKVLHLDNAWQSQ